MFAGGETVWHSEDGAMHTGFGRAGERPFAWCALERRAVTLGDVRRLCAFMQELIDGPLGRPLLLYSSSSGFETNPEAEAQGLVFAAGRLRALYETYKHSHGPVLSVLDELAVGGVYLMHGLNAHIRVATPGTRFYDTVPTEEPVPLAQVLKRGLIDDLVPARALPGWLETTLELWAN